MGASQRFFEQKMFPLDFRLCLKALNKNSWRMNTTSSLVWIPVFPCFAGLWCTVLKATNGRLHLPIAEVEAQTPIDDLNTLVSLMKRTPATISGVEEEQTKMLCSSCQVPRGKNCLQTFAMCATMKGQAAFCKRGVSLVDQNHFPWTWENMIPHVPRLDMIELWVLEGVAVRGTMVVYWWLLGANLYTCERLLLQVTRQYQFQDAIFTNSTAHIMQQYAAYMWNIIFTLQITHDKSYMHVRITPSCDNCDVNSCTAPLPCWQTPCSLVWRP